MNGNQIVKEFVRKLSSFDGVRLKKSNLSRMGRVYEFSGELDCLLYIKVIAHPPHHWGITKHTVEKIETISVPWCVILLYDSVETGYIISSSEYYKKIGDHIWPDAQGDYKISEGRSLKGIPEFIEIVDAIKIINDLI